VNAIIYYKTRTHSTHLLLKIKIIAYVAVKSFTILSLCHMLNISTDFQQSSKDHDDVH